VEEVSPGGGRHAVPDLHEKGIVVEIGQVRDLGRTMPICDRCKLQLHCSSCQRLRKVLDVENTDISHLSYLTLKVVDEPSLRKGAVDRLEPRLFKLYVDSPLFRDKEVYLTAVSSSSSSSKSGPNQSPIRMIQPESVDIEFARRCLTRCQENHGEVCNAIDATITRYKPSIYLLDLRNRCLVSSTVDADYAALSYVWGSDIGNFECNRGNLGQLLKPGSINDAEFFKVPALMKSAIELTKRLGKQYLWIDRCCIVQDDGRHKHEQVMAMGIIYAQACFTIVSLDGDAQTGLPGLGASISSMTPGRQPNILHQTPNCQILCGLRYTSVPSTGSWASRGWTFQEQMLSRRMLIFVNGIIVWKCRTSMCQEDFHDELTTEYQSQGALVDNLIAPGWPDMHLFQRLVENYTRRTLSYPCDSISAFSGVLTFLRGSFFGGFLFGLPELYFDVALLWQPFSQLKDRHALAASTGQPVEPLPTWSWCRWQGEISFEPWAAASECMFLSHYEQSICKTIPIVHWFKIDTWSGDQKPVYNWLFSDYRGQDIASHLFRKWRKRPDSSGFQHSDIDQSKLFRFPIPISSGENTTIYASKGENRDIKIRGNVERAYLLLGQKALESRSLDKKQSFSEFGWHYLLSGTGDVVGLIWTSADNSQSNDSSTEDSLDGERAECIAISKGELRLMLGVQSVGVPERLFHSWEHARRTSNGIYRFYNIMWIDRTDYDGHAYRRAVGRVDQDIWDRLHPEKIEVLLG
jgi:hypothetical protein